MLFSGQSDLGPLIAHSASYTVGALLLLLSSFFYLLHQGLQSWWWGLVILRVHNA